MDSGDANHDPNSDDSSPAPDDPGPTPGRRLVPGLVVPILVVLGLAVVAVAVGVWLAGSDEQVETVDGDPAPATTDGPATGGPAADGPAAGGDEAVGTGQIDVRLEETGGIFIEGFEVGLRFETVGGETLHAAQWTEEFAEAGRTDIDAYYDGVLSRTVPAGPVVVRAEVNVGAGPPPSVPDLTGDLPCSVTVDVAPGRTVTVEVSFEGGDSCLRVVDGTVPTDPTDPTDPTATTASVGDSTTLPR